MKCVNTYVEFQIKPRVVAGFTLLEVLVALVVLGTAISAMFVLLSTTLRNVRKVESAERAVSLGKSKLNELLVGSGAELISSANDFPFGSQTITGSWDELTRWEAFASTPPGTDSNSIAAMVPVKIDFDLFWKTDTTGAESRLRVETVRLWRRRIVPAGQ